MKPAYAIPSMQEIRALPWNGRVVASTFAGGGGSSLGYRMAGFRVGWASEFVEAARETYAANADPATVIDPRDIREVSAEDVLRAIGCGVGDLDVLDGSPPCASYSMAGKREKDWGKVKSYSGTEQRTDDLFAEYLRLVAGLRPRVFVAENVPGMLRGVTTGAFLEVLGAMRALGYRTAARVLDSQWLGVPQARKRLIFVGVREDLGLDPVHPAPLPYRYSLRDALPWIAGDAVQTKRGLRSVDRLAPTIQTHNAPHTESELTLVVPTGERIVAVGGNAGFGTEHWQTVDAPAKTIGATPNTGNGRVSSGVVMCAPEDSGDGRTGATYRRKFTIPELRRICGFPDDYVLKGTYRQQWERLGRAVPPPMMHRVAEAVRDGILRRSAEGADR